MATATTLGGRSLRDVRDSTNAAAEWLDTGGRWRWLLPVLLACWLVPRVLFLGADPPDRLPNDINTADEFVLEPVAKAAEARRFALEGWWTRDGDEAPSWRAASPAWVVPLGLVFSVVGPSYLALRAFSLVVAAAGFLLALALARRRHAWLVIYAVFPLWAFNFYAVAWDRVGLTETMVSTAVVACVYCLDRADEHPAWLVASQLAFMWAMLAGPVAVFALPLVVGANVLRWRAHRGDAAYASRWRWAPVLSAVVVVAILAAVFSRLETREALAWSWSHMRLDDVGYQSHGAGWPALVARLQDLDRYYRGYLGLFPIAGALAGVAGAIVLGRGAAERRWDSQPTLITVWLGSAWLMLTLSMQTGIHAFAVLAAPVTLLACEGGRLIYAWSREQPRPWIGHVLVATVLLTGSSIQLNWLGIWLRAPHYEIRDLNRLIEDRIGEREAVLVGRLAGVMTFETPYDVIYVDAETNADPAAIAPLGPTHALWLEHEPTRVELNHFGPQVRQRRLRAVSQYSDHEVILYEWITPLVAPEPGASVERLLELADIGSSAVEADPVEGRPPAERRLTPPPGAARRGREAPTRRGPPKRLPRLREHANSKKAPPT